MTISRANASSPAGQRYVPQRIWQARERYFVDGLLPVDLVEHPLLQSWERCRQSGLGANEHVAFAPVERSTLSHMMDSERHWLDLAQSELQQLAAGVAEAGYAAMLTNACGTVLSVAGNISQRSIALRNAFRPGVDLSEMAIGTNAMSVAIAERRAVKVLGPEHYFSDNQLFHCCATPIFDPQGHLLGTVDVTRDTPGLVAGAMALTQACAHRIERKLFDAMGAFVKIEWVGADGACLSFDSDGQLIAASSSARRLIDLPTVREGCRFEDIFEGDFSRWVRSHRENQRQAGLLNLNGGVRIHANAVFEGATPRVHAVSGAAMAEPPRQVSSRPHDPGYLANFQVALRAFEAGLPTLVTGETGSGKEVAARNLHLGSRRRKAPFVAINCGAMAPELIASELFGHVEGAFTGSARGGSPGKIEAARGGTMFLDEIGDMPLSLQVALLRLLDSGEILPVGASRPVAVDVRFICATHRDLQSLVDQGLFRQDLLYRIHGFNLRVPPLRERADFDAVLDGLCEKVGIRSSQLSSSLRHALQCYPWPGNVRQLQHALTLAAALAEPGAPLSLGDFNLHAHAPAKEAVARTASSTLDMGQAMRDSIAQAMERTNGNVAAAAALLGISRATLYRKLKQLPR
ncbi:sigma-54-dependent Fis family transcriptional regulator [Rhodoferax sp. GW822-FHT02A01]|uniref:sigma-54-dependent Fis family transcriptional regulator n=1 Tax=Rhodoferax sp. GW822-FHT02A01 TaxID=3141537 RepID=UPI00315D5B11